MTQKIIVDNEEVYLKKGIDGWRIVHPIKNEDGSWNWNNLILGGSIWNFLKILFVILVLVLIMFAYHYDTQKCTETLKNIDEVCLAIQQNAVNPNKINTSILGSYNVTK